MPAARRVLLKLSGEAFGGGSVGLDHTDLLVLAGTVTTAAASDP